MVVGVAMVGVVVGSSPMASHSNGQVVVVVPSVVVVLLTVVVVGFMVVVVVGLPVIVVLVVLQYPPQPNTRASNVTMLRINLSP